MAKKNLIINDNAVEKANDLIFPLLNFAKVVHPLIEIVYVDQIFLQFCLNFTQDCFNYFLSFGVFNKKYVYFDFRKLEEILVLIGCFLNFTNNIRRKLVKVCKWFVIKEHFSKA